MEDCGLLREKTLPWSIRIGSPSTAFPPPIHIEKIAADQQVVLAEFAGCGSLELALACDDARC